jgi:hypothetical protein
MRIGCFDDNRCGPCPIWHVDEDKRSESADQADSLIVGQGYTRDGEELSVEQIGELSAAEARTNGGLGDAGITAGVLVVRESGLCTKLWSEG